MNILVLNPTEEPLEKKHIAYYWSANWPFVTLHEVVEAKYKHPQAPEDMWITKLETRTLKTYHSESSEAAPINLLKFASQNLENYEWAKCKTR